MSEYTYFDINSHIKMYANTPIVINERGNIKKAYHETKPKDKSKSKKRDKNV